VTRPAPFAPVSPGGTGGELVQSLTYRESYAPAVPAASIYADNRPTRSLTADAPGVLAAAAGGAWAVVSIVAAGAVVVVLVLIVVRVVGWLT
jgi:hypothetical protein